MERESPDNSIARSDIVKSFLAGFVELAEEELLVTVSVKPTSNGPVAAPSSPRVLKSRAWGSGDSRKENYGRV